MKKELQSLNRKALLTAEAVVVEQVELNAGTCVHVREMSGTGKDIYERAIMKKVKRDGEWVYETSLENFKAKLCVATVCDEKGVLLFKPDDAVNMANAMSSKNIEKIIEVAHRLNGMDEASQEDAVKK